MVTLYEGSGAGDFSLTNDDPSGATRQLKHNVRKVLLARGEHLAAEYLDRLPFEVFEATNHWNDEFSVLYAEVPLGQYEAARMLAADPESRRAFGLIADAMMELGTYIRFIAVELMLDNRGVELSDVSGAAAKFDVPELHRQIERTREAIENDPSLAIGTAKEIVETTCKTILTERGISYAHDEKLHSLVKMTREALKLLPDDVPNSAKGAESIHKILGSLGAVAQGTAELRSLFGTGHGREGKAKGLTPRHARLAVGSAATLSMFLLETHEERQKP